MTDLKPEREPRVKSCIRARSARLSEVFEGTEKKVELAVVDGAPSLRSGGKERWNRVVRAARVEVLSVRSNEYFDSYLLSESSLFVFDNFVTMITCGRAPLVNAVLAMGEFIDASSVAVLMYERKNENFPLTQLTQFRDDAKQLNEWIGGRALRFGAEHEHAIRLFHTTTEHLPDADDTTLEILMHAIEPADEDTFRKGGNLRWLTDGLNKLLPGFDTDDHVFDPAGYSLNAMRGRYYYTLHVTPERVGSYVSFETNLDFRDRLEELVFGITKLFSPESFDVMTFSPQRQLVQLEVPGYNVRRRVTEQAAGYHVNFTHFFLAGEKVSQALELVLE